MPTKRKDSAKVLLLGGIILDRYFEVDRYPPLGQDTLIRNSFNRAGGCSLNVAITLKNLGTQPYIINKIGDDEIGLEIEQYVEAQMLSTEYMVKASGKQTGYSLIILDKTGERTFFTYRGCEAEFSLQEFPVQSFADFDFAYITGYYLLNNSTTSSVLNLVLRLRQNKCQVLFDPGVLVNEIDSSQLKEILALSDWLLPSLTELLLIQERLDIRQTFTRWLFNLGVQGLIIKKGNKGVEVITPTSIFSIDSYPIKSIDTTGAGDSFAGGFIHGMVNSFSLTDAVALANACGAYSCTFVGPHQIFSFDDIKKFISSFYKE